MIRPEGDALLARIDALRRSIAAYQAGQPWWRRVWWRVARWLGI